MKRLTPIVFSQASQLLVLQGIIIGISGGVLYAPVFVWVSGKLVIARLHSDSFPALGMVR